MISIRTIRMFLRDNLFEFLAYKTLDVCEGVFECSKNVEQTIQRVSCISGCRKPLNAHSNDSVLEKSTWKKKKINLSAFLLFDLIINFKQDTHQYRFHRFNIKSYGDNEIRIYIDLISNEVQ